MQRDIDPLHEVLVGIERVPLDRFEVWQGLEDRPAFHPQRPWLRERVLARDEKNFRRLCDVALAAPDD